MAPIHVTGFPQDLEKEIPRLFAIPPSPPPPWPYIDATDNPQPKWCICVIISHSYHEIPYSLTWIQ